MALTFDDCPRKVGTLMTGMERAQKLVAELKKAKVGPVAFFCNSPTRQPDGLERIQYFAREGHLIANHSATHPDYLKISPEEFTQNIERADAELRELPNFRKWFRFPYLHEGKSPQDVTAARQFLKKQGYKNGYVTISNDDWYMDDILGKAIKESKTFDQSKLCKIYKRILNDQADFFDSMAQTALGHPVKHTILLHETDLNALCIADVVAELRAHGWQIISPDVAYADQNALPEPLDSVQLNQGRVFALAKQKGYKGAYWTKWIEEREMNKEFERAHVFTQK